MVNVLNFDQFNEMKNINFTDNNYLNENIINNFIDNIKGYFMGKKLTSEQVVDMLTNPDNPKYDAKVAEKFKDMDEETKDKTIKYFIFKAENPSTLYYGWDSTKKMWVDTGLYSNRK